MLYLWPGNTPIPELPSTFGNMTAAHAETVPHGIRAGRWFAVGNECFTRPFSIDRMQHHLAKLTPYRDKCLFVILPDIDWRNGERVFDANVAIDLFNEWKTHPVFDGWKKAFVAQNGQEHLEFPNGLDCLFIGGDTDWKLLAHAESCIKRAQSMNLGTHIGRVNTKRRIEHFDFLGNDSIDGTGPVFHPSD